MKPYFDDGKGRVIYLGDCREITAWLAADVMVTDPPYGMAYLSGWSDRLVAGDESVEVRDAALKLWGSKPALVFGRWNCAKPQGARMALTWDKGDWPGMGDLALPWGPSTEEVYVLGGGFHGRRGGSVVRCERMTGAIAHPSEKPVKLIGALLTRCPAGTVADPFMGSGTTLVAAKELHRKAIGIEIDERYCEIAARRLEQEVFDFAEEGST